MKVLNVLLVAEEASGIQAMKAVESAGHRIVAVMSRAPGPSSGSSGLWYAAEKLGYRTWPAKLVKDPRFPDMLRLEKVDVLLNVHSLFIIDSAVLAVPRIGSFNMHPGPLPRYAGLNAVSWAIYRGESTHGVTIHRMVPEIDAGPIAYQSLFPIEEHDTPVSLTSKCAKAGIPLLMRLLAQASTKPEDIPSIPQDLSKRERFGIEIPNGGRLYWSRSAREVVNFVRACDYFPFFSPWKYPKTTMGNQDIAILKARLTGQKCDGLPGTIGDSDGSAIRVACRDEWVLVRRLMLGDRAMDARGILKPGDRLS